MTDVGNNNNHNDDDEGTAVRVRVIAPSSMGKPANLEAFRRFLRDAGMTARVDDAIYRAGADPFYANTDQFRAADLEDALTEDGSSVVWCARGGEGASRLIPYLEALPADRKRRIRDARKTLVGYSDATALHVYLQTAYGWQTIHGTMLEMIADGTVDGRSVDALVALVAGRRRRVRYELWPVDGQLRYSGLTLRSSVAGGNLTLVENSAGTALGFRGRGKIVFLEDVFDPPYSLERSLDHMKLAGMFDGAAAVVFGSFRSSNTAQQGPGAGGAASDDDRLVALVFRRFAATVPFPVFRVQGIGHTFVNNPLPLNTDATVVGPSRFDDVTGTPLYALTVDNVYGADAGPPLTEGGAQTCPKR